MKRLLLPWLTLPLLACSGSQTATWPPSPEEGYEIPVTVDNDLTDRSDVLVRMVGGDGSSLLGGIPPGQERSFSYRTGMLAGSFTLTATTGDGRTLRSRSFTLFPGAFVSWGIQLNDLRVSGQEDRPIRALPHR